MIHHPISTEDLSYRKRVSLRGTNIAYVDVGEGCLLYTSDAADE